ncbi:MAG: N-acetylneuraminate synthase family protein [Vicinamibacterales bacterium]
MTALPFTIGQRVVGRGAPCLVIAEAGVNHNGSLDTALKLVDAAAEAGADVVKFQTFDPVQLASPAAPRAEYQLRATGSGDSQLSMLQSLTLPLDAYPPLQARARDRGIVFLSTPFDRDSADFLDSLGLPAFKIGSGDLGNALLLRHVARKGKPMILSTGMANLDEARAALQAVREINNVPLAVLHCVSAYPAESDDCNLRVIGTMAEALAVPVGFSDHTVDDLVAIAAVAAGAVIIEKHLTLDVTLPGPDHSASLEPGPFRRLVETIRRMERALGDGVKRRMPAEEEVAAVAQRSLYWNRDLRRHDTVAESDLVALRPQGGIPPSQWTRVAGRRVTRDVAVGEIVAAGDVE